jgi:hypothetical protein
MNNNELEIYFLNLLEKITNVGMAPPVVALFQKKEVGIKRYKI